MIPENRILTHPGVILSQEFLGPLGVSQVAFAAHLRVPVQRINELVRAGVVRHGGVEADTTCRTWPGPVFRWPRLRMARRIIAYSFGLTLRRSSVFMASSTRDTAMGDGHEFHIFMTVP